MAMHLTFYWLYSGILLWVQLYHPRWIARFKIQPGTNEPLDHARVWHGIKVVLCNQLFVSVPVGVILPYFFKWRGLRTALPLPSFNWVVFEFGVFMIVEETLFYHVHRLLHTKACYGRFHKQHHEWTSPLACMAQYAHPLEHLLSNIIPVFVGPFIMGSHLAVILVWLLLATFVSMNAHSGIHFPFLPSPEAHDWHHQRFNEIYGLGLFDYVYGTDKQFRASPQYKQHRTFFSLTYSPIPRFGLFDKCKSISSDNALAVESATVT